MSENVTFFGDVADDFDSQLAEAERALDQFVESRKYSRGAMVTASTIIAFMRFGQTFVDVLRLGNGLKQGGWQGIGTDSMRLLSGAGIAGATVSRLSRILMLTQEAGVYTCTWVTTANALRQTGQRFFISLEQLAQVAGVDLSAIAKSGTTVGQIKQLIEGLKKLGLAIEAVNAPSSEVTALVGLLNARSSGALAFAIEYEAGGRTFGHQLFATYSRFGGLTITDTTGQLLRGVGALCNAYPKASLIPGSLFFLPNTAIIGGAQNAARAGGLAHLVLELLPLAVKSVEGQPSPNNLARPPLKK